MQKLSIIRALLNVMITFHISRSLASDRFIEINPLGEIVWDWNTFEEISLNEYNPLYAQIYNGVLDLDWTHSNSVFYDENTEGVYVSIRNLSRISSDYLSKDIIGVLRVDFMENPSSK